MKLVSLLSGLVLLGGHLRAAEQPLLVDAAQSRVEVVVKATMDSFTGKLEHYDAVVTLNPAAPTPVTRARFAFKFSEVKTGNADRDEQMLSWEGNKTYPDGAFTMTDLTSVSTGGYIATGSLVFHGMAREVKFPVAITHVGEIYAVDGDATLDTREFGLPVFRKFMVLRVDPEVHVRFHLQGRLGTAKTIQ